MTEIINRIQNSILMVLSSAFLYNYCSHDQLLLLHLLFGYLIVSEYLNCIKQFSIKNGTNKNILYFCLVGVIWLFPMFISSYIFVYYKLNKIILLKFYYFIFTSDTLQLIFGKLFNKYMTSFPSRNIVLFKFSPNKTIIGYIFGIALSYYLNGKWFNMAYPFTLIIMGICGDLIGSYIKRQLGIKDYSNLLGSHGGIIDRFDSLTISMPFFVLFCNDLK